MSSKNHPDWKTYEYDVIKYHSKTYNHTVWHTDVIPEEELMNAGYIHDNVNDIIHNYKYEKVPNKFNIQLE